MQRHLWLPSFLIIGLFITPMAFADAEAEREALAKIIHAKFIEEGVRFRFHWLRQDLKQVRDGVQSHIDAPRAQPRSFTPLRGDYRR